MFGFLIFLLAAACQPAATLTPFAATLPVTAAVQNVTMTTANTLVPTANPLPSRTVTPPSTPTWTPSNTPTITPSATFTPTPTNTFTPTPTLSPTPIPTSTPISSPTRGTPDGTQQPTWTPPPPDPSSQIEDHYLMGRSVSSDATNWIARTYPYGGTNGRRLQVHHGVDIVNPRGTPIMAVAAGTIFYAGDDLTTLFGSQNNYYGNLVVIQHNFLSADGLPVYSLYGHMDQVVVRAGEQVNEGDRIGNVGGTGVALGPHLHLEVRVGDPYSFDATRNPELWIRPFQRYGTLAGRVTDAAGNILNEVTLTVESDQITRYTYSYADNSVNPDAVFGENYTLGDLPANYYTVTVSENGRVRFQRLIYIYPNRTTWLNVQLNS